MHIYFAPVPTYTWIGSSDPHVATDLRRLSGKWVQHPNGRESNSRLSRDLEILPPKRHLNWQKNIALSCVRFFFLRVSSIGLNSGFVIQNSCNDCECEMSSGYELDSV